VQANSNKVQEMQQLHDFSPELHETSLGRLTEEIPYPRSNQFRRTKTYIMNNHAQHLEQVNELLI